jgi:acyl transferase domain-containing protein/acyl carrier protein
MKKESLAIIGIGCRFPGGADSTEKFWNNLVKGVDSIVTVPKDRWDLRKFYDDETEKRGKIHTDKGGFLTENIYKFDASFFGISPREAETMDPQQRLLLEVTYEAIEDAGLSMDALDNSNTGVFIGGFTLDNYLLSLGMENRDAINSHTAVNTTMTMLSSRLSYQFNLKGPCLTIDTACSSSLVATHYACLSLWNNECNMAIVGGANVILKPEFSISLTKGGFSSKKGKCSFMDASADGYIRGEGAGIIIIKPVGQAIIDNDPIYAVIKGTGVNHDGRTNGITVPNADAQAALIRKLYNEPNIDVNRLHYIEAHGTGTQVGDVIEVSALDSVLSQRADRKKCLIGSVKTNIGHLEASAGIASLIKASLSLRNGMIPPSLHFSSPNTNIAYDDLNLRVATTTECFPSGQKSLVSINGFGYGGTNAHIILEGHDSDRKVVHKDKKIYLDNYLIFPISGRSKEAAKELAKRYLDFITSKRPDTNDFVYNLIYRRTHHNYRAAIIANSIDELTDALKFYADGSTSSSVVDDQVYKGKNRRLVFVYTGMGPQWWRMGRDLYNTSPTFHNTLLECDAAFKSISGWSILAELLKDENDSLIHKTNIAQPANFLIQIGLTALLKEHSIEPDAVIGHSVGEISAAYASGILSLEDAALVIYHRSNLQQMTAGKGGMLAANISEKHALSLLEKHKNVSIAAVNSSESITFSGEDTQLDQISEDLDSHNIFNKRLQVDIPYHSNVMECIKDEMLCRLAHIKTSPPHTPIYSTVTGESSTGNDYESNYWYRNAREPVHFSKAMEALLTHGDAVFLEIGPHPVLQSSIKQCITKSNTSSIHVSTLNKKENNEIFAFIKSIARLHTLGFNINWGLLCNAGNHIKLPAYPWQKNIYWNETRSSSNDRLFIPGNPFLNSRVSHPNPSWEVELNRYYFPFIEDHKVDNQIVFPGACYVAAGLESCKVIFHNEAFCVLSRIKFYKFLVLDRSTTRILNTTFDQYTRKLSIHSRERNDEPNKWVRHATAEVEKSGYELITPIISLHEAINRCNEKLDSNDIYNRLEAIHLIYKTQFRCIKEIYKGADEIIVHVNKQVSADDYLLHPTILDACFQSMVVFGASELVPVSIDQIAFFSSPSENCICHIKIKKITAESMSGDAYICSSSGQVYAAIEGISCARPLRSTPLNQSYSSGLFYDLKWLKPNEPASSLSSHSTDSTWIVFSRDSTFDQKLILKLQQKCRAVITIKNKKEYKKISSCKYELSGDNKDDFRRLFSDIDSNPGSVNILYLWGNIFGSDIAKNIMPLTYLSLLIYSRWPNRNINLVIVLRGTQKVIHSDTAISLDSSVFWGVGRLIGHEYPLISTKIIDLENISSQQNTLRETHELLTEILSGTTDDHIAFRSDERFVLRLNNGLPDYQVMDISNSTPFSYQGFFNLRGGKQSFSLVRCRDDLLKNGQVEVNIEKFSVDTAVIDYITSGANPSNSTLIECFGSINRIGNGETPFIIGDKVVFYLPYKELKTRIVISPDELIKYPKWVGNDSCLNIFSFMKAIYGLNKIPFIYKGRTVLVNNPTSDAGIAAIRYAMHKGAVVIARAYSLDQHVFLTALGATHIIGPGHVSSRSVMEITNNKGVDIIFNTQTDRESCSSIEYLRNNGSFIDCSHIFQNKNDRIAPVFFGVKSFNYIHYDIYDIYCCRTDIAAQALDFLSESSNNTLPIIPLNYIHAESAYEKSNSNTAMTGKNIIDLYGQRLPVSPGVVNGIICSNATYLITGGTSGIGFELGIWLVSKGARNIVLIGRTGLKSQEAEDIVNKMRTDGVRVSIESCDISNKESLNELIRTIVTDLPPLKGIFHCAMVLDDGFLMDMSEERYKKVFSPKINGALNLHNSTNTLSLDFFVCFSSVSSLLGNPGQASYVAANSYLDAFSHYLRDQGVSAITINLGAVKDTGVLTRNSAAARLLNNIGVRGLATAQLFNGLEQILEHNPIQIGFFDIDWLALQENFSVNQRTALFRHIYNDDTASSYTGRKRRFTEMLGKMDDPGATNYICELLKSELSLVLKMQSERIDINTGIDTLGIDSLLVLEFITNIETKTGFRLSPIEVLSGPSLKQLARTIENIVGSETH